MHYKNIPDHRHDTQSDTHSYRHKLSAGADKLSEAEQEVLFSWENLGQLEREMTGKWEWLEHKMVESIRWERRDGDWGAFCVQSFKWATQT